MRQNTTAIYINQQLLSSAEAGVYCFISKIEQCTSSWTHYHHHYHHKPQTPPHSASCNTHPDVLVHNSKWASWHISWHIQKTPPVQVAGDKHYKCKFSFALVDDKRKHHQHRLQRVKTIFRTTRSRMQQPIAACTRTEILIRTYPCAIAFGCSILLLLVPKVFLTCILRWWCFLSPTNAKT